jgi:hypothetical protein
MPDGPMVGWNAEFVGLLRELDDAAPTPATSDWDLRRFPITIQQNGRLIEIPDTRNSPDWDYCDDAPVKRKVGGRYSYRAARFRSRHTSVIKVKRTPCRRPEKPA